MIYSVSDNAHVQGRCKVFSISFDDAMKLETLVRSQQDVQSLCL